MEKSLLATLDFDYTSAAWLEKWVCYVGAGLPANPKPECCLIYSFFNLPIHPQKLPLLEEFEKISLFPFLRVALKWGIILLGQVLDTTIVISGDYFLTTYCWDLELCVSTLTQYRAWSFWLLLLVSVVICTQTKQTGIRLGAMLCVFEKASNVSYIKLYVFFEQTDFISQLNWTTELRSWKSIRSFSYRLMQFTWPSFSFILQV